MMTFLENVKNNDWLSCKNVARVSVCIWLIAQIALIFYFWEVKQGSDQGAYLKIATKCFNKGVWYPSVDDVYSDMIWAPGLINLLILEMKLFGSFKLNYLLNLLMNIGILWNIWYLAKKLFNQQTAYIAVSLFCLTYSNIMSVLPSGTEIPFLFLALTSFSLVYQRKVPMLMMAGILLALANWVRPLAIIFLSVMLLFLFLKKSPFKYYVALIVPLLAIVLLIGWSSKQRMGYFAYQSTSSGVNLIMTSNDKAYGGVAMSLLRDKSQNMYIKNRKQYTYLQKDSIWKARSLEWIKEHPVRCASLYFLKLGGLFIEDSWADRPIVGGYSVVDKTVYGKMDRSLLIQRIPIMILKSLIYYLVLIIFVLTVFKYKNEIFTDKGYLLLVFILGTLSTCVFSISPRYHYPFMFAVYIWAAYGIYKKSTQ